MKRLVKNIFFFQNPDRGGIERNLDLWAKNCAKFDENENYILSNKRTKATSNFKKYAPCYSSLRSLVNESCDNQYKYNVIVFRNILRPLIWITILRLKGIKNINLIYRANNDPLHWFHERSAKRAVSECVKVMVLPFYDLVIYNSTELKERCRYNKNHAVLPNPIDPKDEIIFRSRNKKVLYIGRDAKQKNIKNLITAMSLVDQSIKLTIIGFENTQYQATKNVEFIRWSERIDFANYSFIILPSLYEGSPNALLEGLNNGLIPILTPFKSGGRELIEAFDCDYFLARDFSVDALVTAITEATNADINFKSRTPHQLSFDYFRNKLKGILSNA